MNELVNYFATLPFLEWLAVIFSLAYVVLAAKGSILCWPAALASTLLYTAIFYEVYLWMDSLLQIYYMVMAFYGWYCWKSQQPNNSNTGIIVTQQSFKTHLNAIVILSIVTAVLGFVMATYTPTHFPYIDAATTVFAVYATYLVTQKILENWLYWVVIDFVSIYVYIQKDLTPTAFLFAIYVVIAGWGYIQWRQRFNLQKADI